MRVVVVIPVYKSSPAPAEIASFRQCVSILRHHDLVLVAPEAFDGQVYDQVAATAGVILRHETFDPRYFGSVEGYNQLCLSPAFYQRFSAYGYMLICQLDTWVFRDELDDWCRKGYDFIGAPWFQKRDGVFTHQFSGFVGNGGLSLRKIAFCLQVVTSQSRRPLLTPRGLCLLAGRQWQEWLKLPLKCLGIGNNIRHFRSLVQGKHILYEDMLFSFYQYAYGSYAFPDPQEALRFSFEVHPRLLFEQNGGQLPFGCHAYLKNDYASFWSQYIPHVS